MDLLSKYVDINLSCHFIEAQRVFVNFGKEKTLKKLKFNENFFNLDWKKNVPYDVTCPKSDDFNHVTKKEQPKSAKFSHV